MGWYTNYEVDFDQDVDWDDNEVKRCLGSINCQTLYLRDFTTPRVVISVYSQHNIHEILQILFDCYFTDMRYTIYGLEAWEKYTN